MWEVLGYEYAYDEEGKEKGVSLFVAKKMRPRLGVDGKKAKKYWYYLDAIDYIPVVGEEISLEVEVRGKYEVLVDIYK